MADQIFVTHCLQGDSIKNQAGYGIRAASTADAELLKFAAEYPAYELPLDMQVNEPAPLQAPRRLALLPAPGGKMALIHSAYVGEDTMGRSGNFFSHIVIYRALTAVQALESWCAPEWRTAYANGEPKKLPELPGRPFAGPVINIENLTRFLSGQGVGMDPNLATLVCPPRLMNDAERCQALQMKMLDGFLAAANADPARGRLYFVGEPGLIALLLYGVAKLLPIDAAAKLSFSTFENPKALRQLRLTFASATFTSDPQKAIDSDYFRTRGFGFDAVPPDRCSPDIPAEPSVPAKEFVRLAATNKWSSVHQLHECHFAERVSPASLGSSFRMFNLRNKVRRNELTAEELLELQSSADGQALIQKDDDVFWTVIVRFSSGNETVRSAFTKLIRARADELVVDAGKLLGKSNSQWAALWVLLRKVGAADERRAGLLLKQADAEAPTRRYVAEFRVLLLQIWQQVCATPATIPEPIRDFLAIDSAEEFALMQKAGLPAEWLAYSLDVGVSANPAAPWAIDAVAAAPDQLLEAFVARLNSVKLFEDLLKKLKRLVPDTESYPVLFRSAKAGLSIPPKGVQSLLASLGESQSTLSVVWWRGDNVETILVCMARYKDRAGPIWKQFCNFVSKELLFGNPGQKVLFDNLMNARDKCKACVPAACAELLDEWDLLLQLFHHPSETSVNADRIESICDQRSLPKPPELLKDFFRKFVQEKRTDSSEMQTFAATFDKINPSASTNDDHMTRFDSWQALLVGIKGPEKIAEMQYYFLDKLVPLKSRLQIAEAQGDLIAESTLERLKKSVASQMPKVPVAVHISTIPEATRINKEENEMDESERGFTYYLHLGLAAVLGLAFGALLLFILHVLPQDNKILTLENNAKELATKMAADLAAKDTTIGEINALLAASVSEKQKTERALKEKKEELVRETNRLNQERETAVEAKRKEIQQQLTDKTNAYAVLKTEFDDYKKRPPSTKEVPVPITVKAAEELLIADVFKKREKQTKKIPLANDAAIVKFDVQIVQARVNYLEAKPYVYENSPYWKVLLNDTGKEFFQVEMKMKGNRVELEFSPSKTLPKTDYDMALKHISDVELAFYSKDAEVVKRYKLVNK